ncbi:hypothetical protein JMG10_12500 [Nostoc ellipsosporum NOK]|uniref:hypothetical protein n=1 Tax=Sphingomonas sp. IBVSS2 TaxID=1985172 RepID=UPI00118198C4|nr:hypothetical protein [Sphingomonas sp. IBVSS2]MDF2382296.1 hypothetical protein [Nostoc ellipsosporum NOK]
MRRLMFPIVFALLAVSGCAGGTSNVASENVIDVTATEGNAAVDSTPIACKAIGGRMASPAQCDEYTRQANALTDGIAAFDPPSTMRMGAPETITLVVGKAAEAEAVRNAMVDVVDAAGGGDSIRTEKVSIGENVSAELTSPSSMFKIAPEGRVVKAMPGRGRQVWQWSVEALVPGKHKLTLTVGVPILGSAGEVWQPVLEPKTFEIDVQARPRTWPEFFDDMAKFLTSLKGMLVALAAVIGAAGAVWLGIRKFGGRGDQGAGKDEAKDGGKG